ncbi:MAG: AMP-binding protein [Acidobacteriaceae bacterium]
MSDTLSDGDLPLQRIYHWEKERGDKPFLTQPHTGGQLHEWTWAQAVNESRRMAAYLQQQDWEPGSRIVILSRNCAWWIMAEMAVWMAGFVTVPIYPSLLSASVRELLNHCEPKALFIGAVDDREAMRGGIPPGIQCIRFPTAPAAEDPTAAGADLNWSDIVAQHPPLKSNPIRSAEDLATIIYTSGTTGTPKGVMHPFRTFAHMGRDIAQLGGFTSEERIFSYLPLAHIAERGIVEALGLHVGFQVFFGDSLETFVADLQRARPTLFFSVPRLYMRFRQGVLAKVPQQKLNRLLRIPVVKRIVQKKILRELGLDKVRFAASGAAPLATEILTWYRKLGLDLIEGYGLTETGITHAPPPGSFQLGYVGPALQSVEVRIGSDGEVLMRSEMNMIGYLKDPLGTAACFTDDGFFRTGDLGEMNADGQLKIIGRLKESFKTSKGKYVAPVPIEKLLSAHPAIEASCVMGSGRVHPFAVAVLAPDYEKLAADPAQRRAIEQTLAESLMQANATLDPHERLAFLALVKGPWNMASALVTPTLKIKRAAVEARYARFVEDWEQQASSIVWPQGRQD